MKYSEDVEAIPFREILMIYNYFDLAHKKFNKMFFKEDLDCIDPDLLKNFKEEKNWICMGIHLYRLEARLQ